MGEYNIMSYGPDLGKTAATSFYISLVMIWSYSPIKLHWSVEYSHFHPHVQLKFYYYGREELDLEGQFAISTKISVIR